MNPGAWGKRLLEYLPQKLAQYGVTAEEMIAEDYGWYLPVQNMDSEPLFVAAIKAVTTTSSLFHGSRHFGSEEALQAHRCNGSAQSANGRAMRHPRVRS